MLKKRDGVIASARKQQTRYLKKSLKFVTKLPKTVEQALNAENGNTLCVDAISKELENVKLGFMIW